MKSNKEPISFLYISNVFPPRTDPCSIRTFEISKRLVKQNILPVILTEEIHKSKSLNFAHVKEIPSELEIYRTFTISVSPKFLSNYLDWVPSAYLKGKAILKKRKDIKFIFATSPSFYGLIVGYLLKRKFKLPLIVEYNDPWSFNPYEAGFKFTPNRIFNFFIERKILKSADIILILSFPLKEFLISHFPFIKNKPIVVLEHGLNIVNLDDYSKRTDKKIIFTYAGSLYGRRSVYPLLKIISELHQEGFFKDIEFTFKIFGKYNKNSIESMINKLNISNLVYLGGFISREQVYSEIINSDLPIHIGENLDYPTLSIKIAEYLSCKKKMLYIGREDTYTSKFLEENNFGSVIPLNDFKIGKERLKDIISGIKNGEYVTEVEEVRLKDYTWEATVNKFKRIIDRIMD